MMKLGNKHVDKECSIRVHPPVVSRKTLYFRFAAFPIRTYVQLQKCNSSNVNQACRTKEMLKHSSYDITSLYTVI